ncbi:FKBP-type peptidyl-prolyl cis-trans isomerase domain protein [Raphanus sativus]|nr:FKBP-type peptidyl-prolyl cis-trans isomerase domain protein [Raphanus sativus]
MFSLTFVLLVYAKGCLIDLSRSRTRDRRRQDSKGENDDSDPSIVESCTLGRFKTKTLAVPTDKEEEKERKALTNPTMAISTLTLTTSIHTRASPPGEERFGVGLGILAATILSLTPLDADTPRGLEYYATVGRPSLRIQLRKNQGLDSAISLLGSRDKAPRGVLVHYTARFADGTLFDSTYKRARPLTMRIGVGKVIRGLDQGFLEAKEYLLCE